MNAGRDPAETAYAKEVYAACATVGFTSAAVAHLKRLLDEGGDVGAVLAAAQQAQRESIAWAGAASPLEDGGGRPHEAE